MCCVRGFLTFNTYWFKLSYQIWFIFIFVYKKSLKHLLKPVFVYKLVWMDVCIKPFWHRNVNNSIFVAEIIFDHYFAEIIHFLFLHSIILSKLWLFNISKIKQKGITFDHDFGYSLPIFSSFPKKKGKRKGEWIAQIMIKSHAFLLDLQKFGPSDLSIIAKYWIRYPDILFMNALNSLPFHLNVQRWNFLY